MSVSALSEDARIIDEGSSATYKATLQDQDSAAIAASAINALTLTLFDKATNTIINSRDDQDVNGTNNVTIHASSGLLTWEMQSADNDIVTDASFAHGEFERHVAIFKVTYDSSTRVLTHWIEFRIRQLKTE